MSVKQMIRTLQAFARLKDVLEGRVEFCVYDKEGFETFVKPVKDIMLVWDEDNKAVIKLY